MQQKFFQSLSPTGFHRLAYLDYGNPGAARTVICVHGLTRNSHDFDSLAAALTADGAHVISVDVVGRGQSDWLPDPALYTYPQYMNDMTALLARLDVTEVDWIGTSMGGLIGILLAAQDKTPIRRMILNDVGPFIPESAMKRISTYIGMEPRFATPDEALAYFRMIYARSGPCTDDNYRHIARYGVRSLSDGTLGLAYDPGISKNFIAHQGDVDLWPFYDRVTCPTLLLHGMISDVLTAETADQMTQRGPKARKVDIPGIGHIPGLMDDHQINLIRDFLRL